MNPVDYPHGGGEGKAPVGRIKAATQSQLFFLDFAKALSCSFYLLSSPLLTYQILFFFECLWQFYWK